MNARQSPQLPRNTRLTRSGILAVLFLALAPRAPAQESTIGQESVFRITVSRVQVDAVVADSKGRHVTNLTRDDFEILEDGRPQQITDFSYIRTRSTPAVTPDERIPALTLSAPLRPDQVRRAIALVVDDLGLSWESIHPVRLALRKFVDEQMQAGDLVAVIRTRAGMGALQRFTSDRRLLHAAIDRLRWFPGRGPASAFELLGKEFALLRSTLGAGQDEISRANRELSEASSGLARERLAEMEEFQKLSFTVGSLGALRHVIEGLRELPGRKAVIFFSDGLSLGLRSGQRVGLLDLLRRLIDKANRSSVLVYTMDARGLQTPGLTAEDNVGLVSLARLEDTLNARQMEAFNSLEGMIYLASQTGGFSFYNSNDFNLGIGRVLEDLSGYYLLAYRPDAQTFRRGKKGPDYHKITVKLRAPGLRVRARSGFYGVTDDEARPGPRTPEDQLRAALRSPFGAAGIRMKLTSLFLSLPRIGTLLRNLVLIDADDITFTALPDGQRKALIDVAAVAHGEEGEAVIRQVATWQLHLASLELENARHNGVLYRLDVPVKKPGAYHLRIAVRDSASAKLGTASQFVEIPKVGKGPLSISGISLSRNPLYSASASDPDDAIAPLKDVATRRFRAGDSLHFLFQIYNARYGRAKSPPDLRARIYLLRDGKAFHAGNPQPVSIEGQDDPNRLLVSGRVKLGAGLAPGPCVFLVVVEDHSSGEKKSVASQSIDFEVTRRL